MLADGGKAKYPTNKAGAQYGTGYCDAQCPQGIKFIQGQANSQGWSNYAGFYGSCCAEFDVWEANNYANAFTAHPCSNAGNYKCSGSSCNTACDKSGCDINPYRNGNKKFYGPSTSATTFKLDTTKPFSVVTQFVTNNGLDTGNLTQINRFYVQSGKKIPFPNTNITGLGNFSSMTDANCASQKSVFG